MSIVKTKPRTADAAEFNALLDAACTRMAEQDVLEMIDAHRTTLFRWRRGDKPVPRPVLELVALLAIGRPPQMSVERWGHFRFTESGITTPAGRTFTPNDLTGVEWLEQRIEAQQRRIALLERQLAELQQSGHAAASLS